MVEFSGRVIRRNVPEFGDLLGYQTQGRDVDTYPEDKEGEKEDLAGGGEEPES